MQLIKYIFVLNFLFGTHYYIGDTMSIEDQNKEFDICYGHYPNETFKFSDFNGNLNGGNYKVIMVRMNAVWWGPCYSSIEVFDEIIVEWQDHPNVGFVNEVNDFNQPYSCEQWGDAGIEGIPFILNGDASYSYPVSTAPVFDMLNYCGGYTSYAFLDHTMTVRYKDSAFSLFGANSIIESLLEEYYLSDPSGDMDNDGFPNESDNCVEISNPYQEDLDGDGFGDLCDECNTFLGNINNDTIIDILDVVGLVNVVLSQNIFDFSMCEFDNADTNFDGIINILDIINVINYILGDREYNRQCEINLEWLIKPYFLGEGEQI